MPPFTQLGRYKIESHLGSGAFADVYKAADPVLKRVVALKVLKPALVADGEAFGRFVQEAQVAANLFHAHIATVLDVGEADGYHYLAMRFVDGPSLDKTGVLPWAQALVILTQIGDALDFAHQKGLVHRDVKPQNILLSPTDGAMLTDFGLARAIAESGMTLSGSFMGTPHYMAPELWEGEATFAADQYALACVLVEMLTGKVLFDGKNPSLIMLKHVKPLQLPAAWPPGVPAQLTESLKRALAKTPGERFANHAAFLQSLRHPAPIANLQSQIQNPKSQIANPKSQIENPAGIEWVEIPAGEFLYGDKNEQRMIEKPFLIGKYPVTNAQYKHFLDANPHYPAPGDWDASQRNYPPGKGYHPVVNVAWTDAQAFCQWADCRLPTAAEWEKAARGADGRSYPWGEAWSDEKYCNSVNAKIGGTTPVDKYPQGVSPYGAWDMSGNVWEWTTSIHPRGGYITRGGAWKLSHDYARAAGRGRLAPNLTRDYLGFRCARSSPGASGLG